MIDQPAPSPVAAFIGALAILITGGVLGALFAGIALLAAAQTGVSG